MHGTNKAVPGDLIEAGVFRGGATIFMRALLAAHEMDGGGGGSTVGRAAGGGRTGGRQRVVYVADSFEGIPPSRRSIEYGSSDSSNGDGSTVLAEECDAWGERYAVSRGVVEANFRRYGLLDDRVRFLQGFFNVSLPPVFGPFPLPHGPHRYAHPGDAAPQNALDDPVGYPTRRRSYGGQDGGQDGQGSYYQDGGQDGGQDGQGDGGATTTSSGGSISTFHSASSESAALDGVPALAVVRIDADAYDGVRDALESLYPRLSPGGALIIDDWHLVGAAVAAHEYREKHGITAPILLVPSDYLNTCSVGGARLERGQQGGGDGDGDKDGEGSFFLHPLEVGAVAGPAGLGECMHPKTSLFMHNKHLVTNLPPHVAYWHKPYED